MRSPLLGSWSPIIYSDSSGSTGGESTVQNGSRLTQHLNSSSESVNSTSNRYVRKTKNPDDLLPRPPAPEFDRSVDIMAMRGAVDHMVLFEELLSMCPHRIESNLDGLTALPLSIRKQIYSYLLPPCAQVVSLSPRFATRAVGSRHQFANPWDILEPVMGGLGAFRFLRQELLTYFWLEFRFYVTLSPFTGPVFCPLSQVWLKEFLGQIQYLTIELDMTRLAGSSFVQASRLRHDTQKFKGLVDGLVEGLLARRGISTMAQLNIICRRYVGSRLPDTDNKGFISTDNSSLSYCEIEDMSFCDSFVGVSDILQSCRLSGFPRPLAEILLSEITCDEDVTIVAPEDSVWPSPHPSINSVSTASSHQWSFLPTISEHGTSDDLGDCGRARKIHLLSNNHEMNENPRPTPFDPLRDSGDSLSNLSSSLASGSSATVKVEESPAMIAVERLPGLTITDPSDLSYTFMPGIDMRESANALRTPSPYGGSLQRRATAPLARAMTPNTPNTMNRMNEQDPAYQVSIQAMRSNSVPRRVVVFPESPITMLNAANVDIFVDSLIDSPNTRSPSQAGSTNSSRYMKFVNRLRGQSLDRNYE
ncbi:hypothetical protein PVAG01_07801 [Phlyctema vagabunda]|uniref:F-box domain-containing protein n=1 Tax=Phlyctema vagabunda TaxID=108571 RepID=A0ABR4PEA1_9HELO